MTAYWICNCRLPQAKVMYADAVDSEKQRADKLQAELDKAELERDEERTSVEYAQAECEGLREKLDRLRQGIRSEVERLREVAKVHRLGCEEGRARDPEKARELAENHSCFADRLEALLGESGEL